MSKKEELAVSALEGLLGLRERVSKAPRWLRSEVEEYLGTFRETRIGDACALIPAEAKLSCRVFMAIANPGEQLLASLRRTEEDRTYWSRRKKGTSKRTLRRKQRIEHDDEESEQEEESVLPVLDFWRNASEVKAVTRRRKPAEALFGFRCLFTPGPGETWTTDIRFTSFNSDWICAVEWRGAFNDRSENTSLPVILGFANRRDLYRSTMLLLSQPREWWWFPSGQAEIYPAGRKRPPPHYLKAIQICCRRDGSSSRMGDDDEQSSSWAEVLPLLTEDELREVVGRIDLSDLRGSQAQWMREHGVDTEEVGLDDGDALLGTFSKQADRTTSYRSVTPKKRNPRRARTAAKSGGEFLPDTSDWKELSAEEMKEYIGR